MLFKVTYTRWLKTHDRSHRDYNMRKSFPWHIISRLDFSPAALQASTTVHNNEGVRLGSVVLDRYEHRTQDLRHQFDVTINDVRAGKTIEFRIIFTNDGILITIHPLGKDTAVRAVKDFLAGRYSSYDQRPDKKLAHAIFKEAVLRLLRNAGAISEYKIDQPYPGVAISDLFQEAAASVNRELHQRMTYTIDLSQERKLWKCLLLFQYEAHAATYRYASQCGKYLSLYLMKTRAVPDPNIFANAEVVSIYEHFDFSAEPDIRRHLGELEKRVEIFRKYV